MEPNRPTNTPERHWERGQVLILFSFLIVVLMLCVMAVVDVGFYLKERQDVQKAADAAALAGAQELPDDPEAAEAAAIEYLIRNDVDPTNVGITFECTSDSDAICQDGDGRYDTIVVNPTAKAPNFFGPMLSLIGVTNCWVEGCDVGAEAAGCRGACGPIGNGPVDAMMVLDHSGSMSSTDLSNAKAAVTQMFENFDFNYHRVGLTVTPPVRPDNMCDTATYWTDPLQWTTAQLTDTFQTAPHVLDNASPPVHYTNCVDTPYQELQGKHTNLGTPIQSATEEIVANARPDVVHGMILLTDGAANKAPSATTVTGYSTGQRFCTAQAAVTSGSGDNNGYQTTASEGCADGGSYAADANSGTGTSTNCSNSGKDRHDFYNFGADAGIPGGVSIDGIEVRVDSWTTSTKANTRRICLQLSWDGGSSWTSTNSFNLANSTSQRTYIRGSNSNDWGHNWSLAELSDANFRVRVTDVASNTSTTFRMDAVAVNIYYSTSVTDPALANLGGCDWAAQQATAAKALGIEIFVIGYGLNATERCSNHAEDPSSPYYNYTAAEFLESLASDPDHFYNEPKSGDLDPVFAQIGAQLTGGSRLVR